MPCATEHRHRGSSARRGATVLAVVAAVATLFFAFALTLATLSSSDLLGERRVERRLRARYLAESGLAMAFDALAGGGGSFALDRGLFEGQVRVHVHSVPGETGLRDVLAQGVVDGDAVFLFARCEMDPVLAATGATTARAGGGILVRHQLALAPDLWGGRNPATLRPSSAAVMTLVRRHVEERRAEARKVWAQELAPLGRRRIHALCRQAVDRIVDGTTP